MQITLDQARCFCSLIETGSYQAAAEQMHKSHSAVVYSVRCFEKQSGLKLLNRDQYRTTLTEAGQRVYQQCRSLLESAAQLTQTCSDLSKGWEPTVRLVYDGVLSPDPFLDIFKYFKDQSIPTQLEIYSDYLQGVEKSFQELDAQFMISIIPPKQSGLHAIELKPLTNWLVAHKDHDLIRLQKIWTLEELKRFNFFTVRGAHKSLNLGTKALEEVSTFHMSDFGLKKMAILQKAGFGWLPEYMVREELESGLLQPIPWENPHKRELHPYLYFRKRHSLGRASQIIQRHLQFQSEDLANISS